jgi:hypothetical protein
MNKKTWSFNYLGKALEEAASARSVFHEARLAWWRQKKDEVFASIRSEGLEVEERLALSYQQPKSRDWERGAQVLVRNDLQKQLDECLDKLQSHTQSLGEYRAWQQAFAAVPEQSFALDIEDWLFFFGQA